MPTADHHLSPCDGAALAASVRLLGAQAHRTLNDHTATSDPRIRPLIRLVARLQRCMAERPPCDLARWLEAICRRIAAHGATG